MKKSPFIHTEPVIPPVFAGRSSEIELISKVLFDEKESLVLYGNDAIGKSSIVSTVYTNLILNTKRKIFPVRINAFDFVQAVQNDFLGVTTHQICATIWTKLFKRNYSELLTETIIQPSKTQVFKPEEKALRRIFRIVSTKELSGSGKVQKEFGGKFYIEGKLIKSNEVVNSRKPLASFEFMHLLDELNDIILSYGFSSLMIFCDELNHLPENININILRNYFSVFASKKIQFLIIAVNPERKYAEDARKLIESFNYNLEIALFKRKEDIDELLSNSMKTLESSLSIEDGVSDYLYRFTNGHPWWVQKICDDVFKRNWDEKVIKINLQSVEKSSQKYLKELAIYNKRIKAGLPFRKYDLTIIQYD